MFVAESKFKVANGMVREVKAAFRVHQVDSAEGFVRMDVLCPRDAPDEIVLLTYWTDEERFRAWHSSHLFRQAHGAIPPGLKLDPNGTRLRFFDHISE